MNKQETIATIKEIEDSIIANKASRVILEASLAESKAKLAELDKPELRHGDYGFDKDDDGCMVLQLHDGDSGKTLHESHAGSRYAYVNEPKGDAFVPKVKLGNIFDDLKALAEPLEEFQICNIKFGLTDANGKLLEIRIDGEMWWLSERDTINLHQKLGRLIATAKRKSST